MTTNGMRIDETGKLNNYAIEPKMYVDETANIGFTKRAEIINGRWAMIGFVCLLAYEIITGHTLLG
ncbi:MAG: high light inducible protein [Oscillatoria sp. SIO1A7]|nr:high light inducible protein [Oscillatoria sp. SIO1A7]